MRSDQQQVIIGLAVVATVTAVVALSLSGLGGCGRRSGGCTPHQKQTIRGAIGEETYAKLPMQNYWLDRVNPERHPWAACQWEPKWEGFVQRGVRRARQLEVKPVDLPFDELWQLIEACYPDACPVEGPAELPPPRAWTKKPSGSDPGTCPFPDGPLEPVSR